MTRTVRMVGCVGIATVGVAFGAAAFMPLPRITPSTQRLTVRAQADRVVLAWSGPITAPMHDDVAAAVAKLERDPRRLVLTMNSPGGSLSEGHKVMDVIRAIARRHGVETRIESGGVCASMCVPIYLLGTVRTADPDSLFMFHEVTYDTSGGQVGKPQGAADAARARRVLETIVTDRFYESDLVATRVNVRWLQGMRGEITGGDVWKSARQLWTESSGVVDALVSTAGGGR